MNDANDALIRLVLGTGMAVAVVWSAYAWPYFARPKVSPILFWLSYSGVIAVGLILALSGARDSFL
jgi:hypothetical protein